MGLPRILTSSVFFSRIFAFQYYLLSFLSLITTKKLMTCRLKFANEAVEHLRREIIELASYFSGSNAQNEKVSSDWLIISKINKRKFLVANLNVF